LTISTKKCAILNIHRKPTVPSRAYIIYVRPHFEYASQAWSPHLVTDINKLEAVQRRFTKRLNGMESMEYPSGLKALAVDSLQKRRVTIRAISPENVVIYV